MTCRQNARRVSARVVRRGQDLAFGEGRVYASGSCYDRIGFELARRFASAGNDVMLVARRVAPLEQAAAEIRAETKADVSVLPLDVTGGAVHAMYRTHTALAGRFLYDFHFYHHVSSPMIQALRHEVVTDLEQQPARMPDRRVKLSHVRPHSHPAWPRLAGCSS